MKYVYRLLLEATTKVNGNFIAEIRKVSVGWINLWFRI
jgi:hypothetical protein